MEQMNLEEFKKQYMGKNSKWNFNKFKIVCQKCNSDVVEFNGYAEIEGGYYAGDSYLEGFIVIKCHSCGNAFKIDSSDMDELNTDGSKIQEFHREVEHYDKN